MFPRADHLSWLAERLRPEFERPFLAYHAAVALLSAVASLPTDDCARLDAAISAAYQFALQAKKSDSGRVQVLERARRELAAKCGRPNQP